MRRATNVAIMLATGRRTQEEKYFWPPPAKLWIDEVMSIFAVKDDSINILPIDHLFFVHLDSE